MQSRIKISYLKNALFDVLDKGPMTA